MKPLAKPQVLGAYRVDYKLDSRVILFYSQAGINAIVNNCPSTFLNNNNLQVSDPTTGQFNAYPTFGALSICLFVF